MDQVVIEEYNTEFARIHNDKNYDIACINDITRKVSDILINAADKCQLISDVKTNHLRIAVIVTRVGFSKSKSELRKNRKWFDDDFLNAGKKYLSSKKYHRRVETQDNYINMVSDSKPYKRLLTGNSDYIKRMLIKTA